MEMYKKPIMKIVELEKVDVLTCSSEGAIKDGQVHHCLNSNHVHNRGDCVGEWESQS